MDTDRWDLLSTFFEQARALPPDERQALLDQAGRDDPTLGRELESLLHADAQLGFTGDFDEVLKASLASWSSASGIEEGQTVSHYQILEKLGGGGMGVVYKAVDTKLDRLVVLKFLPPHLSLHEAAKQRFIHEARAASALDHTNICTIYEVGETDADQLFIAMAYYDGETLKQKIERGPLPVEEAVDYAMQMAEGLARAHEKGIVHRDIKPANVMVTERGKVKLLDFGIAKVADVGLTKTGSTLGTPAYMSPEQARGEEVDHRTDVWSLGVVLYEMLAGRRPFRGDYEQAVIYTILHEEPESLAILCPQVPAPLVALVEKVLSKDPNDRHAQMAHLLGDLKTLPTSETTSSPVPQRASAPALFSKRRWVGITVSTLILLVAGVWAILQFRAELASNGLEPASRTVLAVLPFSVSGSDDLAYLGEGMVNLLSTKLDGAGELRSVDPRALLSFVRREGGSVLDPEEGRRVARRFGANLFVMGDMVEAGGQLEINASLYDGSQGLEPIGKGFAAGEAAQVFGLVDELAAQLLVSRRGGPAARVTRVAAVTTSSLPALKAYLDGESAFRAASFGLAVESFQRAVVEDSLFALAYYRLSVAAEWDLQKALAEEAAEHAVRKAERLSDRDQRLLEALLLFRRGAKAEAEGLYRSIVGTYPDDVEAWMQLAEVLFHTNPLRGRSFAASRRAYEWALSYEPEHVGALVHLARIAASQGRLAELDSLVHAFFALNPGSDRVLEMRALQAFSHGDQQEEDHIVVQLERSSDGSLALSTWVVAVYANNLRGAERLARLLGAPSRSSEARTLGHVWLAHLHLARGRWKAAKMELAVLESLDPASALEYRALLSSLPFVPVEQTELTALREALSRLDADAVPTSDNPSVYFNVHNDMHPLLRVYLLGLLNARLGDAVAATQYATQLDQLDLSVRIGTLAADLAHSIRAHIAWQRDRPAEALATLEQARMETWYEPMLASPFFAQAYERFARAELLYGLGRGSEALDWYSHLVEISPFEIVYLPLSHLRRGEIYERLGEPEQAAAHYARFVELWQEADVYFQPQVEQARQSLDRLLEATSPEPAEGTPP